MHRNIHGGMPFYHAFGFTLQNRGTSPLFPGKPPENEMPLEVRKNLGHTVTSIPILAKVPDSYLGSHEVTYM